MQETQFQFLGQEDSLEKEMATHSVFWPEKSHGQRSLVGYYSKGHKEMDIHITLRILVELKKKELSEPRKPRFSIE